MATVKRPTAAEVIAATELNRYITGVKSDQEWSTFLDPYIARAENHTALAIGESTYDSGSLTRRQAAAAQEAICLRTAAFVLRSAALRRATGTHPARLVEGSGDLSELADAFELQAQASDSLLQTGTEKNKTFARPACDSGAFGVSSSDRTPSERNDLINASDDISANDTENG